MKFKRCLSPIPRIQWLTQSNAWELMKWERRDRKASGLLHIFRKALLHKDSGKKWVTVIGREKKKNKRLTLIESQHCTYFNKSLGTCCNTLPKLLTVSARLAFLEKSKCVHVWSYLNSTRRQEIQQQINTILRVKSSKTNHRIITKCHFCFLTVSHPVKMSTAYNIILLFIFCNRSSGYCHFYPLGGSNAPTGRNVFWKTLHLFAQATWSWVTLKTKHYIAWC